MIPRLVGAFSLTLWLLACPALVRAADWPMDRYDAQRSAASPQELPARLHLQWVRQLPALKPAWPDQPALQFDAAYVPVVLGKTMFIGSSRTDSVTASEMTFAPPSICDVSESSRQRETRRSAFQRGCSPSQR